MKSLTVRLPEKLIAEIKQESRLSRISVSEVVRERLRGAPEARPSGALELIGDLIGSVEGLPADLSARRKRYLRSMGYVRNRSGGRRLSRRAPKSQ
ncbi:MAG: ribbon-helix-helix protein, CopG family [Acidobacteria bacterium]|nr:ribbon-helix-helix protein, CopG family [Acidobacteriota bacterium]